MRIDQRISYAVLHGSLLPTLVSLMLAILFETLRRTIGAFWRHASCIVPAALLTCTTMIAIIFHHTGSFALIIGEPLNLIVAFFMSIGFFFLFGHLIRLLQVSLDSAESLKRDGRSIRWMMLVLLLCWLPYLLVSFPGTVHSDSVDQIRQVMGTLYPGQVTSRTADISTLTDSTMLINDMQPVLHTLILGFTYTLFWKLGCGSISILLLIIIQALLTALVMARSLDFLRRIHIRRGLRRFCFLLYALCPVFPLFACAIVKEYAFGLTFFAVVLFLLELITFPAATLRNRWLLLGGAAAIFFFLQFRSFSLALLLLSLVFVLPSLIHNRKKLKPRFAPLLCVLLIPILLSTGLNKIVYPLIGVGKGPERENLSFFFQQTARVVRDHSDDIPGEEREVIGRVLDYDAIGENYTFINADSVKKTAVLDATANDYKNYFSVYLAQLKRYPLTCLQAVISMNYLVLYAIRAFAMLPIVSVFFNIGTYFFLLFYALVNLIRRHRWGLCVLIAPLAYALSLGFSPVSGSTRYAYPLYMIAPLVLLYSCGAIRHKRGAESKRKSALQQ